MMRLDIGDLSREIAEYVPIPFVKQFETPCLQCADSFDAGLPATTVAHELRASGAANLSVNRPRSLTQA
jgi:hypothetical protein